jgi:type II secretory pathway pseudopilin PulG
MIKKNHNSKPRISKRNAGMTYIELIVVISIYAILSSVVIFNHGDFQAKIDIRNLASDVALQIVQAQKSSLAGLLPLSGYNPDTWKPSYGVYFNSSSAKDTDNIPFNAKFIYFADLDGTQVQNSLFDGSTTCTGECLSKYNITKNNKISSLSVVGTGCPGAVTSLTVVFKRPSSGATITSNNQPIACNIDHVQIKVANQKGDLSANIELYPSGRVQID